MKAFGTHPKSRHEGNVSILSGTLQNNLLQLENRDSPVALGDNAVMLYFQAQLFKGFFA